LQVKTAVGLTLLESKRKAARFTGWTHSGDKDFRREKTTYEPTGRNGEKKRGKGSKRGFEREEHRAQNWS